MPHGLPRLCDLARRPAQRRASARQARPHSAAAFGLAALAALCAAAPLAAATRPSSSDGAFIRLAATADGALVLEHATRGREGGSREDPELSEEELRKEFEQMKQDTVEQQKKLDEVPEHQKKLNNLFDEVVTEVKDARKKLGELKKEYQDVKEAEEKAKAEAEAIIKKAEEEKKQREEEERKRKEEEERKKKEEEEEKKKQEEEDKKKQEEAEKKKQEEEAAKKQEEENHNKEEPKKEEETGPGPSPGPPGEEPKAEASTTHPNVDPEAHLVSDKDPVLDEMAKQPVDNGGVIGGDIGTKLVEGELATLETQKEFKDRSVTGDDFHVEIRWKTDVDLELVLAVEQNTKAGWLTQWRTTGLTVRKDKAHSNEARCSDVFCVRSDTQSSREGFKSEVIYLAKDWRSIAYPDPFNGWKMTNFVWPPVGQYCIWVVYYSGDPESAGTRTTRKGVGPTDEAKKTVGYQAVIHLGSEFATKPSEYEATVGEIKWKDPPSGKPDQLSDLLLFQFKLKKDPSDDKKRLVEWGMTEQLIRDAGSASGIPENTGWLEGFKAKGFHGTEARDEGFN